jgi:hypothetical protein
MFQIYTPSVKSTMNIKRAYFMILYGEKDKAPLRRHEERFTF